MRLKSFHARTMTEAMRQVRDALGDDAIIVSSREDAGGIKITAAVEQVNPKPEKIEKSLKKEEAGIDPEIIIEMITETMLRHRVPASVSDKIISTAMTMSASDPQKALSAAIKKIFSFAGHVAKKPIVLVGPPGAGKTLMTAKLAARAALNGKKPLVITTDIARAGGVEQLSAFLDILSVPLYQADNAKELKSALSEASKGAETIIDTGGLNPFDPQEMKFLAKLLAVAEMEPALVLPAGIDAEESAEIALTFSILGVKKLMPTRLDFARRLGGILSAADRAGLSFTEASATPQVAHGILTLTPDILAGLLMPHSPKKK
jgi:flagellar biosynthesis protein FlhF